MGPIAAYFTDVLVFLAELPATAEPRRPMAYKPAPTATR